ncbi:PH domain-containing protein [Metabacillus iocasae]|uniref:Membrane protein YdbS with pleckstrin-like domain n=1 Tax=Priestia iocasae TaxID=2291674 RepID=A0ABS2QZM5_9BACI|nr:PH domain-containing protein [Metabacillus iocasae]MBM7704412.1 membrane protein YdbS with pleckstrin-like domain [Metabacillus iocasae]
MYTQVSPPQRQLGKNAVKVWVISEVIMNLVWFIILGVLFYLDHRFEWKEWIGWVLIGITILSVLTSIWSIGFQPILRYKSWRYDVDEEFLRLKSGIFKVEHQLIPMTKVQAVSTKQGPLLRKYGLFSVTVSTMATSHEIPTLPENVAIELRNQIAQFAKVKEVDE